jgi:hypothetical protein
MDGAALDPRSSCDRRDGLAFGNLGNSPKAAIESGFVRLSKSSHQASPVNPAEGRVARSGCVHPNIVSSANRMLQVFWLPT